MDAADSRRCSSARMSAGQDRANTIATAPATAAQIVELMRSVPLSQPYRQLVAPDAPTKIAAATHAARDGHGLEVLTLIVTETLAWEAPRRREHGRALGRQEGRRMRVC